MELRTLFGYPAVLVLDACGTEIRVEDWLIEDHQGANRVEYELNFPAIGDAIKAHQEKGGC